MKKRKTGNYYLEHDERDTNTPYKAIICGKSPVRFAKGEDAFKFFNEHQGRCLLSVVRDDRQQILKYKFN